MNTDSPVTLVWLESNEERAAWGLWIIDIDGSIQESYGVSCVPERAALWLWFEILSPLRHQSELVIRSQQQKTLSLLKRLLESSSGHDPNDLQHDLLSQMDGLGVEPVIRWMPVVESPLDADIEIRKRTQATLENYQLRFPPEDIDYIMGRLADNTQPPNTADNTKAYSDEPSESSCADDSLKAIDETFGSKSVDTISNTTPKGQARFVGYIEGVSNVYLGAWAFVLIDRESGHGLMRSEGVQLGNHSRMPIMALIGLLESLKSKDQHIEIRSRESLLISQLNMGFPSTIDTKWLKTAGLIEEDGPYISALKQVSQTHTLEWSEVSEDRTVPPIEWALELAFDSLSALNAGDKHQQERRFKVSPEDWAQWDTGYSQP